MPIIPRAKILYETVSKEVKSSLRLYPPIKVLFCIRDDQTLYLGVNAREQRKDVQKIFRENRLHLGDFWLESGPYLRLILEKDNVEQIQPIENVRPPKVNSFEYFFQWYLRPFPPVRLLRYAHYNPLKKNILIKVKKFNFLFLDRLGANPKNYENVGLIVGVDKLEETLEALRKNGYNVSTHSIDDA